jgi:response regulator receiver domain-containing protein
MNHAFVPLLLAAQKPSSANSLPVQVPHGHHTILLVEDEPRVRELAGHMLRRYGYHMLEAADGPTAVRLSAAYAGSIDLLLTDVVMPGGLMRMPGCGTDYGAAPGDQGSVCLWLY